MNRISLTLLITVISLTLLKAQGVGKVFSAEGGVLLNLQDNRLTAGDSVVFSLRNNLIFNGDSYRNEDLLFLLKTDDIFSRENGYVYNNNKSRIIFSMKSGQFYLGNDRRESTELIYVEKIDENTVNLINTDNEVVAIFKGKDYQNTELVASILATAYGLGMVDSLRKKTDVTFYTEPTGGKAIIKPFFNAPAYFEWEWDGRILRPRWGSRPEDEWIFDGKYLRPYWGTAAREEWVWDGKMLKPYWQHIPELEFIYEDGHIYPFWEYRAEDDWVFEEDKIRPKWSHDLRKQWIVEGGPVPIPILAIIVLGIADR